jgi:MSHA pilin protein MshC
MYGRYFRSHGHTLVELIVVLVIVGIISVSVIGRFVGNDAFDAAIVRDQLVSMVRSSQQKALGRRDVSLTLQQAGRELLVTQTAVDAEGEPLALQSVALPARGLSIGYALDTASCTTPGITALNNPLELRFEAPGNLATVNGSPLAGSGMRVCIDGNPALSLCISSTGFAFTGNCGT